MNWLVLSVIFFLVLAVLYKFGTRRLNYWRNKGIKETNPGIPFIGDYYHFAYGKLDALEAMKYVYNQFKEERISGIYIMGNPMLVVREPELLKLILVKDADHFINRYDWSFDADPLLSKSLINLKGESWRNLRVILTTVFTSAKMKDMFTFMEKCSKQSVEAMESKLKDQIKVKGSDFDTLEIDVDDYFSRYAADVIASTTFGVEINSFKEPNNEFLHAGMILKKGFSGLNGIRLTLMVTFPFIAKKLKLTFFGQKLNNYFSTVIKKNMNYREKHNIVRKDVINILMEARKTKDTDGSGGLAKGKLADLDDDDIVAQAMLFYFGGFDTTSSMLGFVLYELALNPDIQATLAEEIDSINDSEDGATYDAIMHRMTYLDRVINEALRKYPPVIMTDRLVTKGYTITKTDTRPGVQLDVGDVVFIPTIAIHHDPTYFPNPEKFDPERFSDEKNTITPYTYLPFGAGMKNCIGMRYAMMKAKTGLFHLLNKFEVVPVKKTEIPLKFEKSLFQLRPLNGIWLGLKVRK